MNAARRPAAPSVEPQPLRRRSSLVVAAWPENETVDDPVSQAAWRAARFSRILRPVTFSAARRRRALAVFLRTERLLAAGRGTPQASKARGPSELGASRLNFTKSRARRRRQPNRAGPKIVAALAGPGRPRDARKLARRKMGDKRPPLEANLDLGPSWAASGASSDGSVAVDR
jgi:hypothetical protein